MRQRALILLFVVVVVGGGYLVYQSLAADGPATTSSSVIGDDYTLPALGFQRADDAYEFNFPADSGPHPRYQREAWTLTTEDCAYQLEASFQLLRVLPPDFPRNRESAWAVDSLMTGTFRLAEGDAVLVDEVADSRTALGLAGADDERVWVEALAYHWAMGQLTLQGVTLEADLTATLGDAEPQTQANWYAYQRTGQLTGQVQVEDTTHIIDCPVRLQHRFGTP